MLAVSQGTCVQCQAPHASGVMRCNQNGLNDLNVCADPGVPENGFRTPSGGVFFESSVTRFHCQDGFKLKGSTKRLCMKYFNGTLGWVPSDRPVCIQEDCRIPQIEDAEIHNKTYRHGDKLIITCHEGFKIRYPDLYNMVSLCRDDGTWDNLPICQGCLRPLASSNGYVNISEFQTSFPVGTVIAYRCFPGFKLEGSGYIECLHNLIWSSSPPRCLALEVSALRQALAIMSSGPSVVSSALSPIFLMSKCRLELEPGPLSLEAIHLVYFVQNTLQSSRKVI
ncbi:Sushi domain-containing protein 4 [Microtus ochrogaster]|uniref:Sushi domain-containing protein 4 n=1 Tax=Microtus ochrogaster TaxID=79684 RepID=A0A8J6KXV7_MICOH|nr:Sushi domain-containing protein 4 [Microtus ochrogaster]